MAAGFAVPDGHFAPSALDSHAAVWVYTRRERFVRRLSLTGGAPERVPRITFGWERGDAERGSGSNAELGDGVARRADKVGPSESLRLSPERSEGVSVEPKKCLHSEGVRAAPDLTGRRRSIILLRNETDQPVVPLLRFGTHMTVFGRSLDLLDLAFSRVELRIPPGGQVEAEVRWLKGSPSLRSDFHQTRTTPQAPALVVLGGGEPRLREGELRE